MQQPSIMNEQVNSDKMFNESGQVKDTTPVYEETPTMPHLKFENGGSVGYAHDNINNEIDRSKTILGWITGGKWKTSKDIPQLSETGKVTPENLSWLYERITKEPDVEYRGGPGGALEAIGSIGKAGALIPASSNKIKNILSQLKMSNLIGSQSQRRGLIEAAKRLRSFEQGSLPKEEMKRMMEWQSKIGYSQKYKDAPQRELEDVIFKLHDLEIPTKKSEKVSKARVSLDKVLERIMKQYSESGMVSPSNEKSVWETARGLERLTR